MKNARLGLVFSLLALSVAPSACCVDGVDLHMRAQEKGEELLEELVEGKCAHDHDHKRRHKQHCGGVAH
ncbi:MAG: hypothetical protein HOW73_16930 [Polyangiaceae bacterium]|nr:hypothetical protein [Polyangiaceae bacterium]